MTPELAAWLDALPKVELHVHLEGTIKPATLMELARQNAVPLPADSVSELEIWLRTVGPENFFGVFLAMCACLRTVEDFERVTYELGAEMARQHVRYAEVHFNVAFHRLRGVGFDTCFEGLRRGRERARAELAVDIAWILAVMRGPRLEPAIRQRAADYSIASAIEGRDEGVVAVGLGGEEQEGDVAQFAPFFERARAAGLHVVPHAGELAGPANVAAAIDLLGAERIAHGARAIEDPKLVRHLASSRICLDLCPTSNVRLGAYDSYERHPIARLRTDGVPVSVSTDDPGVFGIDLNSEVRLLSDRLGMQASEIRDLQLEAVRHSFLPDDRRRALEADLRRGFTAPPAG